MCAISLTLIAFLFHCIKNSHVAYVAVYMNLPGIYRRFYSTPGFIDVHAIIELAIIKADAHFREVVRKFLLANVGHSKLAQPRRIDHFSAGRQVKHFCKSSGMHSFTTPVAYFLRT